MLFADDHEADDGGTAAEELEVLDDVVGSGIFDPPGTATVHARMGVFADHPSVPGYIARHPPFQAQTEVSRGGRETMEVPGGGVALVTFVDAPYPVPMQYPVLYNTPIYTHGQPPAGMNGVPGRIGGQRPCLAPQLAHYQLQRKQSIGQDAPTVESGIVPGSSLVPYVAGGLLVGVAVAMFVGTTRIQVTRNGRRRSRTR